MHFPKLVSELDFKCYLARPQNHRQYGLTGRKLKNRSRLTSVRLTCSTCNFFFFSFFFRIVIHAHVNRANQAFMLIVNVDILV